MVISEKKNGIYDQLLHYQSCGTWDFRRTPGGYKFKSSNSLASDFYMPIPRQCHTLILMDWRKQLCHVDAIAWVWLVEKCWQNPRGEINQKMITKKQMFTIFHHSHINITCQENSASWIVSHTHTLTQKMLSYLLSLYFAPSPMLNT